MRSIARFIMATLTLSIAAAGLASPAGAAAGFGDVDPDRWYTDAVAWMVGEGITNGTSPGCFSPDEPVTRGQILTFMYRLDDARGNEPQSAGHPFTDIVRAYQDTPVGWAHGAGITTGVTETTFAPDASITRGDFAVLLWRYAGRPAADRPHPFTDVTRAYQDAAVAWMAASGITTGTGPSTFSPDGSMTRAEGATFFHRFMDRPTVDTVAAASPCLAQYERLLTDTGFTAAEAACVAPFLVDYDLDELLEILTGVQPLSGDVLARFSDVIAAGCISPTRQADIIRLLV